MADRKTMFAVVQTGAITPTADIVPFKSDEGQRTPAILFVHADRDKCITRRNRIIRESSRIHIQNAGGNSDYLTCTPVLGVVQLEVDLPKKRIRPVAPPTPTANGTGDGSFESPTTTQQPRSRRRSSPQPEPATA